MRFLFKTYYRTVNTHTGAERIRVRNLVSHDHNLVLGNNKLSECLRLYARFHAGILRSLLLFPAEIGNAVAVLDYCLVAAPGKSEIDCHAGILIAQRIGCRIKSETNALRCRAGISDIDLLYFFKNGELVFRNLLIA